MRKRLAAPPSCLITQGTVLPQGFPDLGKVTEASKVAVSLFCSPKAVGFGIFAVWLGLFAHSTPQLDTEPVKLPKQLPGQGGSCKHLWQGMSSWKACSAWHG